MSTYTPDTPDTDTRDESTTDDAAFDFGRFTLRVDGVARRVHDEGDGWEGYEKARLVCERPVRDLNEFLTLVGARDYEFREVVEFLLGQLDGYEIGPHDPSEWTVTVGARTGVWEDFIFAAAEIDPGAWHGQTELSDALSWANNTAQGPVADARLYLALASIYEDRGRADKRDNYIEAYQSEVSDQ